VAEAHTLNVGDNDQIVALVNHLKKGGGRIDVLINNGELLGYLKRLRYTA
jgi:NAD(P)-dependent dehydrogenase (short-subunit alcohol dehydrogenase family)